MFAHALTQECSQVEEESQETLDLLLKLDLALNQEASRVMRGDVEERGGTDKSGCGVAVYDALDPQHPVLSFLNVHELDACRRELEETYRSLEVVCGRLQGQRGQVVGGVDVVGGDARDDSHTTRLGRHGGEGSAVLRTEWGDATRDKSSDVADSGADTPLPYTPSPAASAEHSPVASSGSRQPGRRIVARSRSKTLEVGTRWGGVRWEQSRSSSMERKVKEVAPGRSAPDWRAGGGHGGRRVDMGSGVAGDRDSPTEGERWAAVEAIVAELSPEVTRERKSVGKAETGKGRMVVSGVVPGHRMRSRSRARSASHEREGRVLEGNCRERARRYEIEREERERVQREEDERAKALGASEEMQKGQRGMGERRGSVEERQGRALARAVRGRDADIFPHDSTCRRGAERVGGEGAHGSGHGLQGGAVSSSSYLGIGTGAEGCATAGA